VTKDGVWIGNRIYCTFTTNYNWVSLDSLQLTTEYLKIESLTTTTDSHNWVTTPTDSLTQPTQSSTLQPLTTQVKVKVKVTLRPTTSRSVSHGFKDHEGLTIGYLFLLTFTNIVLSITGAPSDERSGLSFVIVIVLPLLVNIYRFTYNVHVSYKYTYIHIICTRPMSVQAKNSRSCSSWC
jgi:hypothetical protein